MDDLVTWLRAQLGTAYECPNDSLRLTLRWLLALPYADRPSYRQEWRP